jgi:hypothetical protein
MKKLFALILLWGGIGFMCGCASQGGLERLGDDSIYEIRALDVMGGIQKNFRDESKGVYRESLPPKPQKPAFMWSCGVQFSSLVGAVRKHPEKYEPILERFFDNMDRYWDASHEPPGYSAAPGAWGDLYYDDNAWMVITFIEAFEVTGKQKYLDKAEQILSFVMSGWDDKLGGGIYWNVDKKGKPTKNTCSNAPSAVAALKLAFHFQGDKKENLIKQARDIIEWTKKTLQAPNGLYWDRIELNGMIEKTQWTYNTALMIRANLYLYKLTGEKSHLEEAISLGKAAKGFMDETKAAYRDTPRFSHLLIEAMVELSKETNDESWLDDSRSSIEYFWEKWNQNKDQELIEWASLARMLWVIK